MPTNMIKKAAKTLKKPVKQLEKLWEEAKDDAGGGNHGYGLVTHIFKRKLGKSAVKKLGWTYAYVDIDKDNNIIDKPNIDVEIITSETHSPSQILERTLSAILLLSMKKDHKNGNKEKVKGILNNPKLMTKIVDEAITCINDRLTEHGIVID